MIRNIKLTIEYDGKRYLGWQRLGDSDKTIQGRIETVLTQITGETIEIIGSGRTDAGTHARGQVANFKTNTTLETDKLLNKLNHYLPGDILVKNVEEMPERFHARYHASGKQYSYYVWNDALPSVFQRYYSYHVPQKLDIAKMKAACRLLEGTHDFLGFSSLKKTKKVTERTITELSLTTENNLLRFKFVGDGFLYNMVRIMMGTILEIGAGTLELDDIEAVFTTKVRQNAGITVPAQGLFLDEVYYNN